MIASNDPAVTLPVPIHSLPTLAVIVCTFRREQVLVETLQQVLAQEPPPDEVVVVDQTPQHLPETDAYLRACAAEGRIKWVRQSPPSLCAARNQGVVASSSQIVHFLDDDVLLPRRIFLRQKRHYLDEKVSAVTQDIRVEADFDRSNVAASEEGLAAEVRQVDYLRGFNFSVRRTAFVGAGGFDEQFVGSVYRDESDFAQRLLRSGGTIVTDRRCNVVHLLSPAGGCRIPGNRSHPEWTKSANFFLYGFRYGHVWVEFKHALRAGPLRRENVMNPLRWLPALAGFVRGAINGYRRAFAPVRSPFSGERKQFHSQNP